MNGTLSCLNQSTCLPFPCFLCHIHHNYTFLVMSFRILLFCLSVSLSPPLSLSLFFMLRTTRVVALSSCTTAIVLAWHCQVRLHEGGFYVSAGSTIQNINSLYTVLIPIFCVFGVFVSLLWCRESCRYLIWFVADNNRPLRSGCCIAAIFIWYSVFSSLSGAKHENQNVSLDFSQPFFFFWVFLFIIVEIGLFFLSYLFF